uniref:CUT domain-containing protein n=1 Tax=Romanomermis culicivorax TaxID=13658 RepID=A0A915HXK4_ROMCU
MRHNFHTVNFDHESKKLDQQLCERTEPIIEFFVKPHFRSTLANINIDKFDFDIKPALITLSPTNHANLTINSNNNNTFSIIQTAPNNNNQSQSVSSSNNNNNQMQNNNNNNINVVAENSPNLHHLLPNNGLQYTGSATFNILSGNILDNQKVILSQNSQMLLQRLKNAKMEHQQQQESSLQQQQNQQHFLNNGFDHHQRATFSNEVSSNVIIIGNAGSNVNHQQQQQVQHSKMVDNSIIILDNNPNMGLQEKIITTSNERPSQLTNSTNSKKGSTGVKTKGIAKCRRDVLLSAGMSVCEPQQQQHHQQQQHCMMDVMVASCSQHQDLDPNDDIDQTSDNNSTQGSQPDIMESLNTKDLAQRISSELKRYSIPQAIFAQRVLCRSQGTLSDLLRNPKPWSKLKSGRETFRRMWKWLQEPEFQRMSALRLAGWTFFLISGRYQPVQRNLFLVDFYVL